MEIFFGEISKILTRFGNLSDSDWLIQGSHDKIVRFHVTWVLRRLWNVMCP